MGAELATQSNTNHKPNLLLFYIISSSDDELCTLMLGILVPATMEFPGDMLEISSTVRSLMLSLISKSGLLLHESSIHHISVADTRQEMQKEHYEYVEGIDKHRGSSESFGMCGIYYHAAGPYRHRGRVPLFVAHCSRLGIQQISETLLRAYGQNKNQCPNQHRKEAVSAAQSSTFMSLS